ncbi:MAG TPA: peptidyl-prolyl cis-trans isomerase [Gemmatimonadaceae bacterium]
MLRQMRSASFVIVVWGIIAFAFIGGFLFAQTSGLLGRTTVNSTTPVAVVNHHEILYSDYVKQYQDAVQQEQARSGRTLSEDDVRRIQNSTFDRMVMDVLLQQEYERRGIVVTDDEIKQYAQFAPPPWVQSAPELQTDGQFDIQKYQRLLSSSYAKQSGILVGLEQYYRSEIPQRKLIDQISGGVYVTDAELWRIWRDQHDSAEVSYVAFRPQADSALAKSISETDLRAYFDKHKEQFRRPGRAVLSVVEIPRVVTAADSALVRAHAIALRNEILGGAKFEDVAKRESADTVSGANGGDLGKGGKGRFVAPFEQAAYALKVGEISQPVLTPFGYHLIRVDDKKGDTLSLRHILLRIQPSDSNEARIDREADELTKTAATSEQGAKLDTAAKKLGLQIFKVVATEDEPAAYQGRPIPSVSAWAFSGAHAGETSELFDDETGYYLARLDSIAEGGDPKFENVKPLVRQEVARARALDALAPKAQKLSDAAATSGLESAATAQSLQVQQSPMFTRGTFVPGIGQFNEAIGAAFGLPVQAVSAPVRTSDAIFVERLDKRVQADSAAWAKQKAQQRQLRTQQLQQQRVQMYLQDVRQSAKIDDRRRQINAATRKGES